jgi:glycosyltransferase involved in cell wall biosynthesis
MRFQEYYVAALRHGWFDPCFYLDMMQSRGIAPPEGDLSLFEHFATIGWRLGLPPSDRFSVERYLAQYQDVRADEVDPLYHFLTLGQRERRAAFPLFDLPDEARFIGLLRSDDLDRWDETRLALARASGIAVFCLPYGSARCSALLDSIGLRDPFCLHLDCRQQTRGLKAQYRYIDDLLEIFSDRHHYRVRGKPLLVLHGPDLLEDAPLTLGLWREVARQAGLGGLFIAGIPVRAEAAEACGLDGVIDLKGAVTPDDSGPAGTPVFPGFLPDGFFSRGASSAADSPDAFRGWLPAAADRTQELWTRGLPQLAFIDAANSWADGAQQLLTATGPVRDKDREELSQLRRFAQAVTASSRLPVLFLCGDAGSNPYEFMRRLMDALAGCGEFDCFALVDAGGQPAEHHRDAASFRLRAGQNRLRSANHLARALGVRGDVIVVSGSLATADLVAPFAAQGLPIVSFVPEGELTSAAVAEIGRHAQRIIVGSDYALKQISAAGAITGGDVTVLQPPGEAGATWRGYSDEIRTVLSGLGNEGRRIRLTGATAGRQEVAEDLCVVIPSYNHRDYLLEAVESILAQSVRPKEIRIIDDGSHDGSAALARSLASDRLGIFVQVRDNRGAQATINQGVAETGCPIVAVMNSDDRWHPLRIEELIGGLRQGGGADVVFSKVRFFGFEPGCDYKRTWYERGLADYRSGTPLWLALMCCNFFFTTSNLIVRRDRFVDVGGFGPLRYCHDLDYLLAAIFAGQQVRFADQTLCDYRVHTRNTIDEDVTKVLFEEAWIIVKYLRLIFRRLSDGERLDVARRICGKRLASRVIGILHASEGVGREPVHTEPRFAAIIEHSHERPEETIEPGMLVHEMARLMHAPGLEPLPAMRG